MTDATVLITINYIISMQDLSSWQYLGYVLCDCVRSFYNGNFGVLFVAAEGGAAAEVAHKDLYEQGL